MDKFQEKFKISTPIEATETPSLLFKINNLVQLILNITLGCHPIQSVKDLGSAVSLKYEGAWEINILTSNYGPPNMISLSPGAIYIEVYKRLYKYIYPKVVYLKKCLLTLKINILGLLCQYNGNKITFW